MRDVLAKMPEICQNAGFPARLRDGWLTPDKLAIYHVSINIEVLLFLTVKRSSFDIITTLDISQ